MMLGLDLVARDIATPSYYSTMYVSIPLKGSQIGITSNISRLLIDVAVVLLVFIMASATFSNYL